MLFHSLIVIKVYKHYYESLITMNDLMSNRLKMNKGKRVKIYLLNGFYFEGVILENDEKHLIIEDRKTGERILRVDDIEGLGIYGEREE